MQYACIADGEVEMTRAVRLSSLNTKINYFLFLSAFTSTISTSVDTKQNMY